MIGIFQLGSRKVYNWFPLRCVVASLLLLNIGFLHFSASAQSNPAQDIADDTPSHQKDASAEIHFKNADIGAVVRVFARKLKRNYILDERVKGKVTVYLPGKVSADESLNILDAVLALKGFTTVPIGENFWKVVPAKEAIQSTIPTLTEDKPGKPSAAMVTRLLPLKFVSAEDAQQILQPLVSANGLINAYTGTNSLIIIDSESNVDRLLKITDSIDVPFSDREMTIIPITHADATEIAEKLNEILGEQEEKSSGSQRVPSAIESIRARLRESSTRSSSGRKTSSESASSGARSASSGTTIAPRSREPKIIPDERTNSIIVVADEDMTARIRALISQLDSEVDLSGNRFYVYRCQHASAEELADVLSGLSDSGSSSSSRSSSSSTSGSSGTIRNTGSRDRGNRFERTQDRLSSQRRTPGRARSEEQSSGGGASSFNLGEDISITADPATNSLIIFAGKTDYQKLLELLRQLDIKRRQVLVEAMLLEVQIDDSEAMQFEFLTSAGGSDGGVLAQSSFNGNLEQLLANPTQLSNFSIAAASSGTLTLPGDITIPTQTVLLNAAHNNSKVNVLSAPNILATDNEDAEIIVGQNVPFLASTSTSGDNLNNTFNTIDRQDVGITLRLTPQISSNDFVRLDVFTEVSNVIAATLASDLGPTTTIRTSETTVVTKDGQMIVIGGLMSDDISDAEAGVPFLMDIPVLGHAFKSSSRSVRKTNLLIFITPRIIKDQFDARDTTDLHRERTEETIARNDFQPRREDVLRSFDIDRVSEITEFKGEKPGTIRGAANKKGSGRKISPERSPANAPSRTAPKASSAEEKAPIELRISPPLPEPKFSEDLGGSTKERTAQTKSVTQTQPQIKAEVGQIDATARGKLKVEVSHPSAARSNSPRFVILKIEGESEDVAGLPFVTTAGSRVQGIIVPPESGAPAKGFFQAGHSYRYDAGERNTRVKPIGIFEKEQDAQELFPELEQHWYTLSPYEVMNLGKGPWMRTN